VVFLVPKWLFSFFLPKIMLCLCIFDAKAHVGHLHLPALQSTALYERTILWADLASKPPSRRNAEIGSCNRGLFGPKTASFYLFNQKKMLRLCIFNGKYSPGVASKKKSKMGEVQ